MHQALHKKQNAIKLLMCYFKHVKKLLRVNVHVKLVILKRKIV